MYNYQISVPSTLRTTINLLSLENPTTGAFPEARPSLLQLGSDVYHMWTMIGIYNYLLYSNDRSFLQENRSKYLLAMNYIYAKIDKSGLLNVIGLRDWARWQTGFNSSEPNIM
jgi:hypothetical protein